MGKLAIAPLLAFAVLPGAAVAVTCTQVGGSPGHEVTVTLEIASPADGATVTPTSPCTQPVVISGAFAVTGPTAAYDVYIVIDASGSTLADSGVDVDGDGARGGPGDTIYQAEISAAEAFVNALDPALSRVAIVRFNRDALVRRQLTGDLPAVVAALEAMRADRARWGTGYVPALQAVRGEVLARGDRPARRQICLFLSDGQPDETVAQVDAEARALGALGVVIDSFALGFVSSPALEDMALVTGGEFTPLLVPGDIVAMLPDFVPDVPHVAGSHNELTGADGEVALDEASGTFSAVVTLVPGVNHVVLTLTAEGSPPIGVTCAIDVVLPESLVAVAGPPQSACGGATVILDGSASIATTCATPSYRWLDCAGAEACPPSDSPTCEVLACGACSDYTLELSCAGHACASRSATRVDCTAVAVLEPALVQACGLDAVLDCGGPSSATSWWDLDVATDANGDGDPGNDVDAAGCMVGAAFASAGPHAVAAWSRDDSSGCVSRGEMRLVLEEQPPPRDLGGGLCPGAVVELTCGTEDPLSTYWWDLDGTVDADFDGDATNDPDVFSCDATASWPDASVHDVTGWRRDGSLCVTRIAAGRLVVGGGGPGEVPDLRLSREGDAVGFTWGGVPGATSYRVVRGTLASLWSDRAYDHAADAGQGACDTAGLRNWEDPDDAASGEGWYYLAIARDDCGGEGSAGRAWDGHAAPARPPRLPTAACP